MKTHNGAATGHSLLFFNERKNIFTRICHEVRIFSHEMNGFANRQHIPFRSSLLGDLGCSGHIHSPSLYLLEASPVVQAAS